MACVFCVGFNREETHASVSCSRWGAATKKFGIFGGEDDGVQVWWV